MRLEKETSEWDKAAYVCYTIVSLMTDKAKISDFHPYMKKPKTLDKTQFNAVKNAITTQVRYI